MAGDINIMNMPLESILSKLKKKSNKQSSFYVFPGYKLVLDKGKIKKNHWDIYVCKTDCDEEKLRHSFCYATMKQFIEALSNLIDSSIKIYKTTCISEHKIRQLELIRIAFMGFLNQFSKDDLERYEQTVYTKYVYGTTSIEGNTYTLQQTNITLNKGLTVSGKEKREFYEIENYRKLQEYVKSKRYFTIDVELIKKIHRIIMQNIDDDGAGCFRNIDVGIVGTEFVPSSYIEIDEDIESLIKWYKDNEDDLHPVELATGLHQKFEQVHPFKDGNGRVGRELVRIILRNNYYPTIFIDNENREEYLSCLDAGSKDESYQKLCEFFVDNLIIIHKILSDNAIQSLGRQIDEFSKFCEMCGKKEKCSKLKNDFEKSFNYLDSDINSLSI